MQRILQVTASQKIMATKIHPTAIVSSAAHLDQDVEIGPYAVIGDGVKLGSGVKVASFAVIENDTTIGSGSEIFTGAVIGSIPQDLKYDGAKSSVVIGENNIIREYVTINLSTAEGSKTIVGNSNLIMAYSHVAHDCVVGNNVVMANTAGIAGEVVVHDKAFISAAVTVHQFCRVGRNAMIGLSSKVVQDALPFCITDGNPGRARSLNLVGLKRNGFAREDIAALKEAYRLLYQRVPLAEAVARMRAMETTPTTELADFIEGSKRGFAHPTR